MGELQFSVLELLFLRIFIMDFSIPLVFVVLFIMACLSLVVVYKYGMREKSYEEALAEQRQQTHALLGTKAKPKEKKHKKPSKKVCFAKSQSLNEIIIAYQVHTFDRLRFYQHISNHSTISNFMKLNKTHVQLYQV